MYDEGGSSMMQADAIQPLPQGQITTVNEMQMYYAVYGEGSPLILLHGFTQTGAFWQPYIATLAEHFRLIVPDLRGHGRSTNPTNQFTHRQAALDIIALLEQLGIHQFKAMGFSSGADCLLHVATRQPSRVEALVLVGSSPYWPQQTYDVVRQLPPDSEQYGNHFPFDGRPQLFTETVLEFLRGQWQ